jgi:hypothetical protein
MNSLNPARRLCHAVESVQQHAPARFERVNPVEGD